MQLFLMQHGTALSEEQDAERPLSRFGIEQVRKSAAGVRRLLQGFDLIACSPKRRAHQTAALVAEAVRFPYSDILVSEAFLPKAEPDEVMSLLDREAGGSRILLVGHQPCLGRLAACLLQGGEVRFENAGLCALRRIAADQSAILDFLLTAEHLAGLGASRISGS